MAQAVQTSVAKLDDLNSSGQAATGGSLLQITGDVVRLMLARRERATPATRDRNVGVGQPLAFTGGEHNASPLAGAVDLPPLRTRSAPTATLHALQEWEGHVVEVGTSDFTARLVDLTDDSAHGEEEAIIPLDEISDYDATKMREGSIFRWVIGYERSVAGSKKRVSHIVFRELPAITKSDLRDGEAWARETIRSLNL